MKKIAVKVFSFLIFIFLPFSKILPQTIISEGTVSGNWTVLESPYLIEGNITITDDSVLTIEPGVKVEFQGHYELNVHGVLLAVGTETDTISFTINDTTGFSDIDTTLGGWNGINFRAVLPQNDTSKIKYCKIEYCKNVSPIWPDDSGGAILIEWSNNVLISNSMFNSNFALWGGAIRIVYSELFLSDCIFINNYSSSNGGALTTDFSTIHLDNCNFIQNKSDFNSGAINAWKCDLNINRSNFIGNRSTTNYGAIGADSCNVIINNTLFESNSTVWGGGLAVNYGSLELTNSYFKENYADHGGGLISGWSNNYLSNVTFDQNSGTWGGGMSITNCSMEIDSCLFIKNSAADQGGGIEYIADTTGFTSISHLEITNSKFEENSASIRCGVAIIEQYNSNDNLVDVLIDNCEFENNNALRIGVLRIGNVKNFTLANSKFISNIATQWSSASAFVSSIGSVYNTIFIKNHAYGGSSGGAGVNNDGEVDFINCTFANNSSSTGGGLHLRSGGTATATNTIFWGNLPDQISLNAINDSSFCTIYLNYNDIEFGLDSIHVNDTISNVFWGEGNINSDPLFVDTSNIDYHLSDLSPCIGAGTPYIKVNGKDIFSPGLDIEGNPRPSPSRSDPDIGAFENLYGIPTNINRGENELQLNFELSQNYPNPFNPSTTINYEIPDQARNGKTNLETHGFAYVELVVYDILGRKVATLVNETQNPGFYEIEFNGNELTSGIYFYKLSMGTRREIKKMVLVK